MQLLPCAFPKHGRNPGGKGRARRRKGQSRCQRDTINREAEQGRHLLCAEISSQGRAVLQQTLPANADRR